MKTCTHTALCLFMFLALRAPPAGAALVTWTFQGTLASIGAPPTNPPASLPSAITSLGVQVGAPLSGFVRFDTAAADEDPNDPARGLYEGLIDGAELTIGSYTVSQSPPVSALPNLSAVIVPPIDTLGSGAQFFQTDVIDPTHSFDAGSIALEMSAPYGSNVWLTDALLASPPALGALDPFLAPNTPWGGTDVVLFLTDPTGTFELRGQLTSLVPEPGAWALLGLALALLAKRRPTQLSRSGPET